MQFIAFVVHLPRNQNPETPMLKTTYKTRNARRRMDELRRVADEGAQVAERYARLINTQTLPINYPYKLDHHA